MIKQWLQNNLKGDSVLWGIVIAFSLISVAVVYSATGTLAYKKMEGNTEYFLFKHTFLILVGLAFMWAAHKVPYRYYSRLSLVALILSAPLLIVTFFYGSNINDASRWITIPVINQTFQPSDLAKLALISYLASMLSKKQHELEDWKKTLLPMLIWTVIICALIALTNTSTAVLLFATCMLLMFIGRVPFKYLASVVLIGVVVGGSALAVDRKSVV